MKNYAAYEFASISMTKDKEFSLALDELFEKNEISHLLETGTYLGLGSTSFLANSILKSKKKLPIFFTLEVDGNIHKKAKKNLKKYPFVQPIWGLSVRSEEAVNFTKNDDAILNHEQYPDVFIDDIKDPIKFYLTEIEGKLSKNIYKKHLFKKLKNFFKSKDVMPFQENIFGEIIPQIKNLDPLFLLDSAGSLGYLEFNKIQELMDGCSHFLILDDIHHIKHFRSYRDVKANSKYTILAENLEHGWLIARYKGN